MSKNRQKMIPSKTYPNDDSRALKTLKDTYEERGIEKGRAIAKEELRTAWDGGWEMRNLIQKSAVDPIKDAIGEMRCTLTHIVAFGQMPVAIAVLKKAIETDQLKLGNDMQGIKVAYNQLLSYYPDNAEMKRRCDEDIAEIMDLINPYDAACSDVTRGNEAPLRTLARKALPTFETLTIELQNMTAGRDIDPETRYLYEQGMQLKYTDNRTWEEATDELIARLSVGVAKKQYRGKSVEHNVFIQLTQGVDDPVTTFKQAYHRMAKKAY